MLRKPGSDTVEPNMLTPPKQNGQNGRNGKTAMVAVLMADLKQRGVELAVDGDRLRWRAPEGVVTADVIETLRSHKPEVIAALAERADAPRPQLDAEGLPVAPCPACGGLSFWRWPQSSPYHDPRAWVCLRCTPIPPDAGPCDACCLPPTGSGGC